MFDKTPTSELSNSDLPENCKICNYPAVGHHYDVPSCRGCKSFFRRTIITGRRYHCKYNRKCWNGSSPIDWKRRTCGECRFEKCIEAGMNPLVIRAKIISEEGELIKKEILDSQNVFVKTMNIDDELSKVLHKLTICESQMDKLYFQNLPHNYVDLRTLFEIMTSAPSFRVPDISNLSLLNYQLYPTYAGYSHNSFLSIVEFMKLFDFYTQLPIESCLKLVKHGTLICRNMVMSFASINKYRSDLLCRSDGSIAGIPMRNYHGVWIEHREIIQKTMNAFVRNKLNNVEYMFLKAIVVCNPALSDLSIEDQKIIGKERYRYAKNFLTYCFHEYGNIHGPNRFSEVLSLISIMELQQSEQRGFHILLRSFYRSYSSLISPLYDEIMETV